METLIGILLYIGAISPNNTYTTSQLLLIEDQNEVQVENVENNPTQLDSANDLYELHGNKVIWFDDPIL